MAKPIVEVDGVEIPDVVSVDYANESDRGIGQANITVGNTASIRQMIAPGDDVVVKEPDKSGTFERTWSGEVVGNPSNAARDSLTVEVEAEKKTGQLEYAKVSRPFIEQSSGDMLRSAIEKRADPNVQTEYVTEGDSMSGWSSNADNVELLDVEAAISNNPTSSPNSAYFDFLEGRSGTFDFTYEDVPSSAAPGRRIERIALRMLGNTAGGLFDAIVVLVDGDGVAYKWDIDLTGGEGFQTYELNVVESSVSENASDFAYSNLDSFGDFDTGYSPPSLSPNTFRVGLRTAASIPDDRAVAIDYIETTPFDFISRDLGVETDIQDKGTVSTRRFDSSILDMAKRLAQEDGSKPYVTPEDTFVYEPSGQTFADISIDGVESDLPIVDFTVDRDFDVRNRVTVNGAGNLQVSFEDPGSIEFYNREVAKQEPIDDPSIRTREQAKRRARGFLADEAWDDGAITVVGAGPDFRDLKPNQVLPVTWEPEDIDGTFLIGSTSRTQEGLHSISLSGNVTL